jgi:hypothetical protein
MSVAVLLLARDAADWIEDSLAALRLALAPGDRVALADLGSTDGTAALLARVEAPGLTPEIPAAVARLTADTPDAAALSWAIAATGGAEAPGHLIRLGGGDILRPEGMTALRAALAADPAAIRAPVQRWWIEPGVILPPSPLAPATLVLRRDLAATGWPDTVAGAVALAEPLLRSPLPPGPLSLPDTAAPDFARRLLAEALTRPDAPAPDALARAFARLLPGEAPGEAAIAARRLEAAAAREAALAARLLHLRARADAARPDPDGLIRSFARLRAEIAARDRDGR